MQAPGSLSADFPFKKGNTIRAVYGVCFRYVFRDGTELHIWLGEIGRPEIRKLIEIAIEIHGPARIEMPRPGRLL